MYGQKRGSQKERAQSKIARICFEDATTGHATTEHFVDDTLVLTTLYSPYDIVSREHTSSQLPSSDNRNSTGGTGRRRCATAILCCMTLQRVCTPTQPWNSPALLFAPLLTPDEGVQQRLYPILTRPRGFRPRQPTVTGIVATRRRKLVTTSRRGKWLAASVTDDTHIALSV